MEALGIVFLVLIALFVVAVLAWAVVSIPDLNRYRRLRKM